MAHMITVDASGRITIPKAVRSRHHLVAGAHLSLVDEGKHLVLKRVHTDPLVTEKGGLIVFCGRLTGQVLDHRELREGCLDHHGDVGGP